MGKKVKIISICMGILLACSLIGIGFNSDVVNASSNIYYVSETGDDTNHGTLMEPFRTIQKAASIMIEGDTCYIKGGVYRETVIPSNSGSSDNPITFEAYNNEKVVISGGDIITNWTQHSGSIYKGDMDWDLGGQNIVAVDGNLSNEARWPNVGTDLHTKSVLATVDSATNDPLNEYTITDHDLSSFPADYWNGGLIWCLNGPEYYASASIITDFSSSTLHFKPWARTNSGYNSKRGNKYYITRHLNALDTENEWYVDGQNQNLYIWMPGGDNPANHVVEAKKRTYTFDLRNRSYINIKGIDTILGSITTVEADHCTISNGVFKYIDQNLDTGKDADTLTKGLELGGTDNVLRDSEIAYTFGRGIKVSGTDNQVINCYIHDVSSEASNAGGIDVYGRRHLISHNTVYRLGRGSMRGSIQDSIIEYNDFSYANMLTEDSGVLALGSMDYQNTQIHHNYVHDNAANYSDGGLYADCDTRNLIMYRNVVWNNSAVGLLLNTPNNFVLAYNNSFYNSGSEFSWGQSTLYGNDMYGDKLFNNIFRNGISPRNGCEVKNNIINQDPNFVNPSNGDLHIESNSVAIDAGMILPNITDNYIGDAPDAGAYEYGDNWIVGHDFDNPPYPLFQKIEVPYMNKVLNGGFEYYDLSSWTKTGNLGARLTTSCNWDYHSANSMSRGQITSAVLGGGDGIEQDVTGLKPSTTYVFSAWAKINGYHRKVTDYDNSSSSSHWNYADGKHAYYRDVQYVGPVRDEDWVAFDNIDFGSSKYDTFAIGRNKTIDTGSIEVRLDSVTGTLIGTLDLDTFSASWAFKSTSINSVTGVHDLYLVFKNSANGDIGLMDSFKLYNSNMTDDVQLGVKNYGGDELSTTVDSINWGSAENKFQFTTGIDDTTATIYAYKPDGEYYAYVDDFGVIEELPENVHNSNLISNLNIEDTENESHWSIMSNIQSGDEQFGDRIYTISSLPTSIAGSEWIKTAIESYAYIGDSLVNFTVNSDAEVYVGYPDEAPTPTWLSTWIDTDEDITNNYSKVFSLYKKEYVSGSTVSLGAHGSNLWMYMIIVK
ncbi:hypothetical protein SH1V18_06770 [Vallitalea longa]|uniref:CBM6 domain-containing protein n=1 Tax=Vallitalea longa TaxID=2936439 RepID=A0A9W5Y7T4_9FIRM|nr:carbohydrate-binding protein [Vallitalea longa]GKX28197.1 hypothetical protein SH1V18_06770 [Vallitalea longa]